MVRPSNPSPRLSLLPDEIDTDVAVLSLDWLRDAMTTPEGAEDAYTRILATIRERDQALKEIQTHAAQVRELIEERDQFQYELLQALRQQATSREPTPQP